MNSKVARARAAHAASLTAAGVRELERVLDVLDGAPPTTLDVARLALDDARRLASRVHGLRRRIEELGPPTPAAA